MPRRSRRGGSTLEVLGRSGYAGYGELFVFVFFGIVAVAGTVYVCCGHLVALGFVAAIPVGLCAVALLVVNNLRDISTDAVTGKHTLAVRLGASRTQLLYAGCLVGAIATVVAVAFYRPWALIGLVALVVGIPPIRRVYGAKSPRELIAVLGLTGRFQLVLGGLLVIGIAL